MRIRKHAKILSPANGAVLHPHVCQLNQSPWDIINFAPPPPSTSAPPPPPPSQASGYDSSAANGSSSRSISVPKREISGWRRPDTFSRNTTTAQPEPPPPSSPAVPAEEDVVLCAKTDGKSWRCQREASKGNPLCDHHLSQMKSYTSGNSLVGLAKKSGKQSTEAPPPRRGRPKKAPPAAAVAAAAAAGSSSSSSNPYEFYYYSGFGPRWGKKRGVEICSGSGKKAGHENVSKPPPLDEEDDEFDYENEEEEKEVRENNGRKRPRKPVKERSLKSLM